MSRRRTSLLILAVLCMTVFWSSAFSAVINPGGYIQTPALKNDSMFGGVVAVSGDTMVVGAYGDSSGVAGINGDEADLSQPKSGAVYVFIRNGSTWVKQAYLKASNPDAGDYFGISVAIDGNTLVVGASDESSVAQGVNGDQENNDGYVKGAVYVFVRNGNTWTQQAYLKTNNTNEFSRLGYSVAISGDTIVAGAFSESTFSDGNYDDTSHAFFGAAYVFKRNGTTWSQEARLIGSNTEGGDCFGQAVAISGDTIIIGATGESSKAVLINGDGDNNEALSSGAAYVFVRQNGVWTQQAYLKAPNAGSGDFFGACVALSGETAIVSAPGEGSAVAGVNGDGNDNSKPNAGAAYVFKRSGTSWSFQSYLKASNPSEGGSFGVSAGINGGVVVIGAALGDNGEVDADVGAVYVFGRNGTDWSQIDYIKPLEVKYGTSMFGVSVAISKATIMVGSLDTVVINSPIHQVFNMAGAVSSYSLRAPSFDSQSLMHQAGVSHLSFASPFEADFSVSVAGDLTGEWTVLGTAQKGGAGRYEFNDSTAGAASSRFYRIRMD